MATVAKVAVQAATYAIDKVYDYLLPPELAGQVGCRVLVPFGRGNRLSEAVILSLRQEVPDKPLKAVRTLRYPGEKGAAADAVDDAAVFLHILRCAADGASHGGVVSLPGDMDAGARA